VLSKSKAKRGRRRSAGGGDDGSGGDDPWDGEWFFNGPWDGLDDVSGGGAGGGTDGRGRYGGRGGGGGGSFGGGGGGGWSSDRSNSEFGDWGRAVVGAEWLWQALCAASLLHSMFFIVFPDKQVQPAVPPFSTRAHGEGLC
jgi:hypothetical protein